MADNRIYNFSAGPSMLPVPVLERCAAEMCIRDRYDDGSAERTPKEGAELYGFGEILELLEQYQQ